MSDAILVINAGSSSIKFKLFRPGKDDLDLLLAGKLDGIGVRPRLTAREQGKVLVNHSFTPQEIPDTHAAQRAIGDWMAHAVEVGISAVGHRVVHGGLDYSKPVLVDDTVLDKLASFIPLAPLHQLGNLDPIREIRKRSPDLPQVACFDTAFHRSHPEFADRFPLPRFLHDEGVRRYGFHGLSYEYVSSALKTLAPGLADKRLIVAHLGSGASLCAIEGGRSVESTMGFTALDGIPMGTRSGALDPGVVLHLIEEKGMSPAEVGHMLYHDSGLAGLSGISNDVRELLASPAPEAAFAIDFFCRRVAQAFASLSVSLRGVDAIVFTAGIGENAPPIRQKVVDRLEWAGLQLDPVANGASALRIDAPESRAAILVVPTDEEKMIALHTLRLVRRVA